MASKEQKFVLLIGALAALLLAASGFGQTSDSSLPGRYVYWLVRIAIEGALFILVRDAVERYFDGGRPAWMVIGIAILISLFPFVLAITALDIILGFPELGIENAAAVSSTRLKEFGLELLYLLDNHIFLCILLAVPRYLLASESSRKTELDFASGTDETVPTNGRLLAELDPPLNGDLMWAEAQEHYVRLTTSEETRMVLHRFADVLRGLSDDAGLQVHRSHWVAFDAVSEVFKQGTNLRLRLHTGDIIPVSRSYRAETEKKLKELIWVSD